jgi:hypothetical protein
MQIGYLRRLTIRNLVSPYGLAMVSYALFLFAWVFPPAVYTTILHEPDLMFLDPLTFVFYTVCVAAFLLGARSSRYLGISTKKLPIPVISARSRNLYLIVPIIVATACCTIYLFLLGAKLNFIGLVVSQQGEVIKGAWRSGMLTVAGKWNASPMFLTSVLWWALFRAGQLNPKGATKFAFYLFFCLGLGVDVLTCVATVDRTNLMPLLSGLLVLYLYRKSRSTNVRLSSLALIAISAILSAVSLFSAFFFLRGSSALGLLAVGLLGYSVSPYDHLAAMLHGVLHYRYEGRGVYLASYFLGETKLNTALGLSERFNFPTPLEVWQGEFNSTAVAGLNPMFIWSGVFGYLYSDIGWWTLLYLICAGLLAAYLWARFNAGKPIAIVLYLWIANWVLFWFGWNLLLDFRAMTILESGLALALYDHVSTRRANRSESSPRS